MKQHQRDAKLARDSRKLNKRVRKLRRLYPAQIAIIEGVTSLPSVSFSDAGTRGFRHTLNLAPSAGTGGKSIFEYELLMAGKHPTKKLIDGKAWNVDADGSTWRLEA